MNYVSQISQLVDELSAKGTIGADDVLRLRQEVWKDGVADRNEVEAVFHLDNACHEKDPAWTQFYVDALAEYFVWNAQPRKYVSEENARYLIDNIVKDGKIDSTSELELLINITYWAISCPEELYLFALEAVKDSVLNPETAAYGSNRPPAVISSSDVEIIRKVIYSASSPGGFTVTKREAELLFELSNKTIEEENASTWPDLFAKGVANFLMFPRGAPIVPSAEEAMSRERWLEERRGVGEFLSLVGKETIKSIIPGNLPVSEARAAVDPFGKIAANREREREDLRVKEALSRESIDRNEAKWLITMMAIDGKLNEAERSLLRFIKQNSPSIDPLLLEVMDKAGI